MKNFSKTISEEKISAKKYKFGISLNKILGTIVNMGNRRNPKNGPADMKSDDDTQVF